MVRKNHFVLIFWIISLIVIVVDQISKYFVLCFTPKIDLGILSFHLTQNTGAGFGILQGRTFILGLISLLVAVLVIAYYKRIPRAMLPQVLSALFLGGVIGNMIDRLFRGFVIDFIDLSFWPSFNVADACISVAVVGLIICFWKEREE